MKDKLIKKIAALKALIKTATDQKATAETVKTLTDELAEVQADLAALEAKEADDAEAKVTMEEMTANIKAAVESVMDERKLKFTDLAKTVKEAVEAQFAGMKESEIRTSGREAMGKLIKEIIGKGEAQKPDNKMFGGAQGSAQAPQGEAKTPSHIEIPTTLNAGNLPVHFKQLLNAIKKRPQNDGISEDVIKAHEERGWGLIVRAREAEKVSRFEGTKVLSTGGSGTGAEWMPTVLGAELMRRLYLQSELARLFMAREIEMPSGTFELPFSTTRPTFYMRTATPGSGAVAESTPGTAKPQLVAQTFKAMVTVEDEANEDSIIAMLPTLQMLLAEAAADALESVILNGDITATHQDADTNAITNAAEKSFAGLRKLALAVAALNESWASGGVSTANMGSLLKKLGKYAKVNPGGSCAWVFGEKGHTDALLNTDVLTWDKRGPTASTLTGELPTFLGIPVIASSRQREDVNASGVQDGITTDKRLACLVNHTRFLLGNRRDFTIETDRDIQNGKTIIVASFRKAFKPMETPSATISSVAYAYNF